MTPTDPDPYDVPGLDRALGIDDPVPDAEYGDRGYHPERELDGGQTLVDDLHEALLEVEQELRELETRLPEPLTLSTSITEVTVTAEACARVKAVHRADGESLIE
ncbi:hypothetical protein [Natronobiforma cellulositropha]|uniref:hypothetical protein n=1 Tax=Natronobiforma cellulositropha TaxID=1679076 RepID=UPI0021D5E5DF|nr:hypothetical protein [Natronobiforma cellulositropha]